MKKTVVSAIAAFAMVASVTTVSASPILKEEKNLTPTIETKSDNNSQHERQKKLAEIGNKYEVGEFLSDKDADFVRTYASLVPQTKESAAHNSETAQAKSATTLHGTKSATLHGSLGNVQLSGTVTVDLGFFNNSINGFFVVQDTKGKKHKSLGSITELRCFGVFGEGGTKIGLVYSQDYKKEDTNTMVTSHNFSDNFFATVAYYNVDVRGLVDGDSFSTY
ncbi:hypothetical protein WJ0W_003682 [Paenibacillus melissococcoides]|uniref:Uncharacterized protein n=1 Tax=Paenibacillus melissococcoides TaxID=2912268 RepID=A0ABM9G4E2_9BACL|nr:MULTISPECIES: hypothetical protein [Paenibacillus]MEB9898120.1 hypothetical protein [Bacillus cereus]CAH8246447.1 hypothetical protein WJ0W_003682 [Paenibacillus melissococcoides]CAH8714773.1 hypothetical protein HTL2_004054 [Paenibacillus melissococcoides]CAH8715728.1 hypothetical protein WDD9_004321 [Paenibacillus melissococcoides]GIO83012.1 hypothetical protein J6TS7_66220 [Paenibacillus dendritiformis]